MRARVAVAAAVTAIAVLAVRGSRGDSPADPTKPAGPAGTLPASIPGNVEISAEHLEVDTKDQSAVLWGKVVFSKGTDLVLRCPKIEVKYESSGPRVSWAKGSGGVTADVKGVRAEAPELELDLPRQKLWLRGGVRLYRGQGWVAADGAEIDLASARVTMTNVKASLPVGNLKKP